MANEEKKLLANVSYAVYEDSPDIIIDIELDDYTDASINALCSIIENISSDVGVLNTINMIKDALVLAGEEEALLILLTKIGQNIVANAKSRTEDKDDDPPCILPSDML
jgi:hypothetical protein